MTDLSASSSPVPALLRRITTDPGRPRLTWYGVDGERVELSGHVLDNWVTKTTNLLVEEMDAGPGTHVVLDLPAHWRTAVWALATWRSGACVLSSPGRGPLPADPTAPVVVTTRPGDWTGAAGSPEVVAVELAALARAFAGDLPPGAIDAAGAVMTYGDVLTYAPAVPPSAPALTLAKDVVAFGDLHAWAYEAAGTRAADGGAPRLLLELADDDVPRLLATTLAVLGAGGSLVLVDRASDTDRARVAEAERVTARA